jgi:hypothetical protein
MRTKRMFAAIAVTAALAAVPALAQQPQRVRGTIESVDGSFARNFIGTAVVHATDQ